MGATRTRGSAKQGYKAVDPVLPLTLCCADAVGYYAVGGVRLESARFPRWYTRWLLRALLDWDWVAYEPGGRGL